MSYCSKCGANIDQTTIYCPNCGTRQTPDSFQQPNYSYTQQDTRIAENVAALLCYLFMPISGLVFYCTDTRPFVRFHAMQSILCVLASIVLTIGLGILTTIIGGLFSSTGLWGIVGTIAGFFVIVGIVIPLFFVAIWFLLMVKAYQKEWFQLPIIGKMALQKAYKQ